MEDPITIRRINLLHPIIKDEVMSLYKKRVVPALSSNVFCRFAYTLRTFAEQDALYAQGRTKLYDVNEKRLGVITNAKGGQSFHNYGLALDIVLIDKNSALWNVTKDFDGDGIADWMEVVDIFVSEGWEWGGNFKSLTDYPHLQKSFGYSTKELLEKYNKKDFIQGTNYINL